MQLLQEKFAEKIWLENQYGEGLSREKVESIMFDCNLMYRKNKTYSNLVIAIGNGYKNGLGKTQNILDKIAEEVDRVLIRKRWDY